MPFARRLGFALLVLLASVGCEEDTLGLTGTWSGRVVDDGDAVVIEFILAQRDDDSIGGHLTLRSKGIEVGGTIDGAIKHPDVDLDLEAWFPDGSKNRGSYVAKLEGENRMKGTIKFDGEESFSLTMERE